MLPQGRFAKVGTLVEELCDAVSGRSATRCGCRPCDLRAVVVVARGQVRDQRRVDASAHQRGEGRQPPGPEERVDDFPGRAGDPQHDHRAH
jgi:hypothetical protein